MGKELIKGISMLLLLGTVAFVTSVASAYGQGSRTTRANVPFDFIVGNTTLPAGEYTVASISGTSETLRIQNTESQQAVYRLTTALGTPLGGNSKLVFHRYGAQYFLAEVWGAGDTRARQVMKSRSEKAAEHEIADVRKLGGQAPTYERVEIVALAR